MAKLSEDLWTARLTLEERRKPSDPSTIFLGELANLLEEYDVIGLLELRIKLDEPQPDNTPVDRLYPIQHPIFSLGKGEPEETE